MRHHFWTLSSAIVVWTCIAAVAVAQANKSATSKSATTAAASSKAAADGRAALPNARGSTLVTFKQAEGERNARQAKPDPLDWTMWRGPEQNGISRETGLVEKLNAASGENVLWINKEAGGISTPVIMNGRLYTIVRHEPETRREQEKVLCLDAATGEKLWENRHNVYLSGVPAERVGWSCVAADPETGLIYAQGVNGYFQCLDGTTGEEIWSRSMHEEFGLLSTYGGRTNTPAIFEDMIIAHSVVIGWGEMGVPAHRFIAMDKLTGEVRWYNGTGLRPEDTTFGTPVFTVLGDQEAMVFGSCDGSVWAFQPRTGKPIWNFKMSRRGINITPVVKDNVVYACQGEETLDNRTRGSVAAINGVGKGDITRTNEIWLAKGVAASKASPLLVGDRLYVADDGANLFTFEAKTGKRVGARPTKLIGTMLASSPVWADGKIYIMSTGALNVFEPTDAGLKSIFKARLDTQDIIIGSPAISHGRIYLPLPTGLYCLGKEGQEPKAAEDRGTFDFSFAADENDKPAWVQVVPCEVLMKPGETQRFSARLFNDRGQFIKESAAAFTSSGGEKISDEGIFTAPGGNKHTASTVTAKVGELTGTARVRIVPPLPWSFDFEDIKLAADSKTGRTEGEPPITWVGARYRHKIRDVDGSRTMVKVTYIPKGTRSQCWMGPVDLHDYTIQADLKAGIEDNQLPDMGVIAQRYALDMMGQSQKLQIRSWHSQVRTGLSKTVPFDWKPNVWYTMKFQATAEGSSDARRAVLRGKVWPRGDKEPSEWNIEAIDERPNLIGSPGLYGDATNAEIYIDNIKVTSNDRDQVSAVKASASARSTGNAKSSQ